MLKTGYHITFHSWAMTVCQLLSNQLFSLVTMFLFYINIYFHKVIYFQNF